jgi:DNA invertase Pin-like site-specific DNA recombinase
LSVADFVAAVAKAAGVRGRSAGTVVGKPSAKGKHRKRAKITAVTRAQVTKLVAAGKTGAEIAKAVKISPASVQNIKKALGLVNKSRPRPQLAGEKRLQLGGAEIGQDLPGPVEHRGFRLA